MPQSPSTSTARPTRLTWTRRLPALGAARHLEHDRHQYGCGIAQWALHRTPRRRGHARAPPRWKTQGRKITTIEGLSAGPLTPCPARVDRRAGASVRLLPVGHFDDHGRASQAQTQAHRRRHRRGDQRPYSPPWTYPRPRKAIKTAAAMAACGPPHRSRLRRERPGERPGKPGPSRLLKKGATGAAALSSVSASDDVFAQEAQEKKLINCSTPVHIEADGRVRPSSRSRRWDRASPPRCP